jgi:8-oxo-dGTP pyrophosphatase MutT (NUDIX family)
MSDRPESTAGDPNEAVAARMSDETARTNATQWTIHGERLVDETRRLRLSIAEVELPDGVKFEQYVLRMPPAAMMVVIDDRECVLLAWRHRFIIDRWVWELPGGYVDPGEDPALCAVREFEEETGWRPLEARPLVTCQPIVGSADAANLLFVSNGAEYVGHPPDINEAERVEWIPLSSVSGLIDEGKIVGSSTIIGLLLVLDSAQR